jgi:hypothetical protein
MISLFMIKLVTTKNTGAFEVIFIEKVLERTVKIRGKFFQDGEQEAIDGILELAAESTVLERVYNIPGDAEHCVMDIRALLFQMQCPAEIGVPILYTTPAGSLSSVTHFSYTKGECSRWPHVQVFDDECCVAQLVCLLQFGFAPRYPQHAKPKCINHGFKIGKFYTKLFPEHQKRLAKERAAEATNPICIDD